MKILLTILLIAFWIITLVIAFISGLSRGYTNLTKENAELQTLEADVLRKTISDKIKENDVLVKEIAQQKLKKFDNKNSKKLTKKRSKKNKK
jgi:regulator of replication initiation timing